MNAFEFRRAYPEHLNMSEMCFTANIGMCKLRRIISLGLIKCEKLDTLNAVRYLIPRSEIELVKELKSKDLKKQLIF